MIDVTFDVPTKAEQDFIVKHWQNAEKASFKLEAGLMGTVNAVLHMPVGTVTRRYRAVDLLVLVRDRVSDGPL